MSYNILFLNWQCIKHPLGGGAEVYHHEILKRIAAKGHSVTWLCSHYPGLKREKVIDGIRIIRTGSRNLFNYRAPSAVKNLLESQKFDILLDSINKIPLMSPLYAGNIPIIGYIHHLFRKTIFSETIFPFALYVYLFEKGVPFVYRNVPFCAVSESTRKDMIETGIGVSGITIIENCVDHDLYKTSDTNRHDGLTIGYLGRIKKYKSVDHLIRAFGIVRDEIPEAKLIIVGDGDNLTELQSLTEKLGLSGSVDFTGYLAAEEKVSILQRCAVVGNPSIKEGWGLTVIEANACGTPVVAANVQGLRDSVVDGKTGLLYSYGNIEELASNLTKVLTDKELRSSLSDNAVEWAAKFNWDTNAEKTLDLISEVIGRYRQPK